MTHHDDSLTAVGAALAADVPLLLWGDPGQGKTAAVASLARRLGWHMETVVASLRDPTDFAGLPIPDLATGRVRLAPPRWALALVEADADGVRPLLFLDEITTASPAVQAALLRVVHEGVVGDLSLPGRTVVVAAANPGSIAAGGFDLAPPTANRFVHLSWALPATTLATGLRSGTWPEVPVAAPAPQSVLRDAAHDVAGYLEHRPSVVTVMPRGTADGAQAFPTPRTWEFAVRLLAVARHNNLSATATHLLLAGAVGEGAATGLLTWLDQRDLPDPERILADPARFAMPVRRDQAWATIEALVAAVTQRPTAQRWTTAVQVLCQAGIDRPDLVVDAVRRLTTVRPHDAATPAELEAFTARVRPGTTRTTGRATAA